VVAETDQLRRDIFGVPIAGHYLESRRLIFSSRFPNGSMYGGSRLEARSGWIFHHKLRELNDDLHHRLVADVPE